MTRGELREELEKLRQEFKLELKQELVHLATKTELEMWGGALLAHIDRTAQRLSAELSADLARHTGAIQESMLAMFAASDEKYADLPGRVSRLEAAVFAPKQR